MAQTELEGPMGNNWPGAGHRGTAAAFKQAPVPGQPGWQAPRRSAQIIPFPGPTRPRAPGYVRYGKWLRPSRLGVGGVIAARLLDYLFDEPWYGVEEFVVPPGWTTDCITGNPLLLNNPKWDGTPSSPACGFGGPIVGPGPWDGPPPVGYFGYGGTMTYDAGIPGYSACVMTPSDATIPNADQFRLWFQYWSGRFIVSPEPVELPELPAMQPVPKPTIEPLFPYEAPLVERGPMFVPRPIYVNWPTPGRPLGPEPGGQPRPVPAPISVPPGTPNSGPPKPVPRLPRWLRTRERLRTATNVARKKPPAKSAERKFVWQATGIGAGIAAGLNVITESADFFEAAWWALSPSSRARAWSYFGGKPTFLERVSWTLNHTREVNPEKFIKNLAANQFADMVGGLSGKAMKRALQDIHAYTGLNLAGRMPSSTFNRLPSV